MTELAMFILADELDKRNSVRVSNRKIRDATDPFDLPDERFLQLFKLSKAATMDLLNEIVPYLKGAERNTFIPLVTKLVTTLHFYGSGSSLKETGKAYACQLSKTMVWRSILQVTQAIDEHMADKYIKFPTTTEMRTKNQQRFFDSTGFPNVIGAIDCTHIKIKRPKIGTELNTFKNSQGYYSKNVQIICDYDLNILACYARFGGAVEKTSIWQNCGVRKYMENMHNTNEDNCWLIGDLFYPLEPWLITPFSKPQNEQELKFNERHAKALECIHKLIYVLRNTFRCLSIDHGLLLQPEFAGAVINCCCTLHNFRQKYKLITTKVPIKDIQSTSKEVVSTSNSNANDAIRKKIISKYF